MKWLWSKLAQALLLFVLLVIAIGAARLLWPSGSGVIANWQEEIASPAAVAADVNASLAEAQSTLAERAKFAQQASLKELDARIAKRKQRRVTLERELAADQGFLGGMLPSAIVARRRAEIELALIDQELALLESAREPRSALEALQSSPSVKPPTQNEMRAATARCERSKKALSQFNQRGRIEREFYELTRGSETKLKEAEKTACGRRDQLAARVEAAERKANLERQIAAIKAEALPARLAEDLPKSTLRDIVWEAFLALLVILLFPLIMRVVLYFGLAPFAEKWPPMRFRDTPNSPGFPAAEASRVSVAIILGEHDEALVRQDYLQSSSLAGAKRTRWLLDWSKPLTSLASGMRFLTGVSGEGQEVLVSAVKDPLAELALLEIPQGAAAIVRPSALAGLVQQTGQPITITPRWRFSLPALLTFQFRYLAFHGPAKLVLKGGRGVRIEAAQRGRIVGQGQLIGFSTDLAYSVVRTETFWPYFFGHETLLKDRVEEGQGVLLIEEAPLAGRGSLRRGFDGAMDAVLKLFGV